ncbi:MAG: GNAT family N-acetyltransferase [Burkholderiaceae bacterium]
MVKASDQATGSGPAVAWQVRAFDALSGTELYALLALRQEVFVVEQSCIFPDIDWFDQAAVHLLGWSTHARQRRLAAYLRLLPPGVKFRECSIGRVVSAPWIRSAGVGRSLVAQGLVQADALYPGHLIRIGAQMRLERFYGGFGFETVSKPYKEDGIMHVEMLRRARTVD